MQVGVFRVNLLAARESAFSFYDFGEGQAGEYASVTGTAAWTTGQKEAVERALTVLSDSFTNPPGRDVEIAIAMRDDLSDMVLGNSSSSIYVDLAGGTMTTSAEAVWRDGNDDLPVAGAVDNVIQMSSSFPWYYGPETPDGSRVYDFQSTITHEIVHALGISSGYFGPEDGYLYGLTRWTSLMVDSSGNVPAAGDLGFPDPLQVIGPEGTITWVGEYANATYGGAMPIFTDPDSYLSGSSLSHPAPMGELMGWGLNASLMARAPTKLVLDIFRDLGWSINSDFYNAFGPTYYRSDEMIASGGDFVSDYDYAYAMYVNGSNNQVAQTGVLDSRGDFGRAFYLCGKDNLVDISGELAASGDYAQAFYLLGAGNLIWQQGLVSASGLDSSAILLLAAKNGSDNLLLHSGETLATGGAIAIRFDSPYDLNNGLQVLRGSNIVGDIVNTDPLVASHIGFGYSYSADGEQTGTDSLFDFVFNYDLLGLWDVSVGGGITTLNGQVDLRDLTIKPDATLKVGSLLSIPVDGSLRGSGLLDGSVSVAGLTAPGNSIGTLTISGDYTQSGMLELEIDNSGSDRLVVGGDASFLDGSSISFLPLEPVADGSSYSLLAAGGAVTGTPTLSRSAVLNYQLSETAAGVDLSVSRQAYASLAVIGNQRFVAQALDTLLPDATGSTAELLLNLDLLSSAEDIGAAYASLSPAGYCALPEIGFAASGQTIAFVSREVEKQQHAEMTGWQTFGRALAIGGRRDDESEMAGYKWRGHGFGLGAGYRSDDALLGVTFSNLSGSVEQNDQQFTGSTEAYFFGVYGAGFGPKWLLDAQLGGGFFEQSSGRQIVVGTSNSGLVAEPNAQLAYAHLAGRRGMVLGDATKTNLTIALDTSLYRQESFTETGLRAALRVEEQTSESARLALGGGISHKLKTGPSSFLVPALQLTWERELGDNNYQLHSRLDGVGFSSRGQNIGRDRLLVGCELDVIVQSDIEAHFAVNSRLLRNAVQTDYQFSFTRRF